MRNHLLKIFGAGLVIAVLVAVVMAPRLKTPVPAPVKSVEVVEATKAPKYKRDMLEPLNEVPVAVKQQIPAQPGQKQSGRPVLQLDRLAGTMKVTSALIQPHEKMPNSFTCYEKNKSPPLSWSGAPGAVKSYVVFFKKLTEGQDGVLQWIAYNIAAPTNELPMDMPKAISLDSGVAQGINDLGSIGYAGPCQPKGRVQYVFEVFALDADLKLPAGLTRDNLINAINGHIIDMGTLPAEHYRRF